MKNIMVGKEKINYYIIDDIIIYIENLKELLDLLY